MSSGEVTVPAAPCPLPALEQPLLSVLCVCTVRAGNPEHGLVSGTQESTPCSVSSCRPSSKAALLLYPCPQSLPVETLGPESGRDPESERAPQAPRSPSKAAAEDLAGTLDGGGNRALLRGAVQPPVLHVLGFPSFLRERKASWSYSQH